MISERCRPRSGCVICLANSYDKTTLYVRCRREYGFEEEHRPVLRRPVLRKFLLDALENLVLAEYMYYFQSSGTVLDLKEHLPPQFPLQYEQLLSRKNFLYYLKSYDKLLLRGLVR